MNAIINYKKIIYKMEANLKKYFVLNNKLLEILRHHKIIFRTGWEEPIN